MRKSPFFPRRLFRWFILKQIISAALVLIVLDALLFFWLQSRPLLSQEAMDVGRDMIFLSLGSAILAMVLVSFFMARQLVIPLGRLIEKTRRLRRFPFDEETYSEDELAYDEPGEWYDLERALNKLGRDLRQKTIRLSREKTELRAITSAVNEGILAVDQERRPLFYNSEFAMLFGLHGREPSKLAVSEILRSPEVLNAYDQSLRSGESVRVETSLMVGGEKWARSFQVSIAPLRKKHNQEVYGTVGIFHDISDMKKAEKIRIDFVANVSHELRTPLTSIKGYVQALLYDYEKGDYAKMDGFLKVVEKNVDRLVLLVNDLLDLSSLESGGQIHSDLVNTREITEAVLRQVNVCDHVVHMHYNVDQFYADATRVEQVVRNLIQNAVRYVPKGESIFINWDETDQGHILLRVKDTGPGIPQEHQERLFERFYRIDGARSREVGGTGIGLSIVKHIMQRHGGSIRLESEPGKGSEFICEFPN